MGKFGFIFGRLKKMNFDQMKESAARVSERNGKPKLFVYADMIWCGYKYAAGYVDYDVFHMDEANGKERKTYITRGVNDKYIALLNDVEYRHFFENKVEFNKAFADYIGREWIEVRGMTGQAFAQWLGDKEYIIAKPNDGMCGRGIEKLKVSDFKSVKELFDYLTTDGAFGLVEECLAQHEDMSKIYSGCINTVRIVTLNVKGKVSIPCAFMRIGNGGSVDNFFAGGMTTPVDLEEGVLKYDAINEHGVSFSVHPTTGVDIHGFKIPMWEEAKALVLKAAEVIPQVGYVGWDVAFTPKGPVLVEGNEFPGHVFYQLPAYTFNNQGLAPVFDKIIYGGD